MDVIEKSPANGRQFPGAVRRGMSAFKGTAALSETQPGAREGRRARARRKEAQVGRDCRFGAKNRRVGS